MKRKQKIGLMALLVLILSASIPSTIAYFTTYASALGRVEISLQAETEIIEQLPTPYSKHIQVQLDQGSQPVYVRVRAFSGSAYPIEARPSSANWKQNGQYWEYMIPLFPEEGRNITDEIVFEIQPKENEVQNFNIVVVSESIPVKFDENGNPLPADWNKTIEIERGEGE